MNNFVFPRQQVQDKLAAILCAGRGHRKRFQAYAKVASGGFCIFFFRWCRQKFKFDQKQTVGKTRSQADEPRIKLFSPEYMYPRSSLQLHTRCGAKEIASKPV